MNYDKLLKNLADWMISHGTVISDRNRSNEYNGVRIVRVNWRGNRYRIIEVDGLTCIIERV